jgi:hypothetical protein
MSQSFTREVPIDPDATLGGNSDYVVPSQKAVKTYVTNSAETATSLGAVIGGAADATPNDTDNVATALTGGGILKKITWTNVKAFIKTYFDTLYAVTAKGVTNGDSHDHLGGDGGTIAYSSLSTRPALEVNANDIFQVASPGGVSAFVGTINGAPSGSTVTYNVTSGQEGAMKPASSSQLGKIRLYNTTRGTRALISDVNTATNVITLTASVPAGWANGDTITIASDTVSSALSWIDVEITSGPTGKTYLFLHFQTLTASAVGDGIRTHPYETFATAKSIAMNSMVLNVTNNGMFLQKITGNVFSMAWTGSPTSIIVREGGYLE